MDGERTNPHDANRAHALKRDKKSMKKVLTGVIVSSAVIAAAAALTAAGNASLEGMAAPKYDGDGQLVRPENYREWVFVGASLGLTYSESMAEARKESGAPGAFHHVYIQPEAYRHYAETGKFPEKTMLVMENYSAASKHGVDLSGFYQDEMTGLEVALKDHDTFEEGWAYFNFSAGQGKFKEKAKAFPKEVCWSCHDEHAADDNVFVQFYPVLRQVKPSVDEK